MTRTDRGTGAAEVPDPGRGKARGPKNPPRRAAAGGAGCGAAVRLGCWVRPALLGLPVEQRQTAEAGGHRGGLGVSRAQVLDRHSMRRPRSADRDGARRLRVCVADVPVVLGPAAGQATFAPGPGAAAAGRRARVGSVAFEVPPETPARRHMKYEGFVKK